MKPFGHVRVAFDNGWRLRANRGVIVQPANILNNPRRIHIDKPPVSTITARCNLFKPILAVGMQFRPTT